MKHTLIFCSVALTCMMSLGLTSCSNEKDYGDPLPPVTLIKDLKLNVGSSLPLAVGMKQEVVATITNDSVTAPTLAWNSTNPVVATVTPETTDGPVALKAVIEAKSIGTTTIQIADPAEERIIKSIEVSVMPVATGLELKNIAVYEKAAKSIVDSITLTPGNAYNVFEWSSSDQSVVTVDADGTLHGIKPGTATLTAKTLDGSNITKTATVTVKKLVPVENVAMSGFGYDMMVGETEPAIVEITPSDLTPDLLTWESSDPKVAMVDGNGRITAVGTGTTTIKASDNVTGSQKSSEIKVTVSDAVVSANMANMNADLFKTLGWSIGNGGNVKFDGKGMIVEPTQTSGKRRADFSMFTSQKLLNVNAGTYRYFVMALTPFGHGSIKLNTSKGDFGAQPAGWLEGGQSKVAYWDLQAKFPATSAVPSIFELKMADIDTAPYGYTVYWLHTFKTLEDAQTYVDTYYKK